MKVVTTKAKDQELIMGLRSGESTTLKEIYQTFYPPVRGFIKNHGGNEEDAKDMFQEGVMVLYRMVQQPDFELESAFLSLLFPVCRNLWFKAVRKRPYYEAVEESREAMAVVGADLEAMINTRAIDQLFREKLTDLGDQCQKLLDLFFEGKAMQEIVKLLGLSSVSFAKKKKFQCKEKLVQLVKGDPIYAELKI